VAEQIAPNFNPRLQIFPVDFAHPRVRVRLNEQLGQFLVVFSAANPDKVLTSLISDEKQPILVRNLLLLPHPFTPSFTEAVYCRQKSCCRHNHPCPILFAFGRVGTDLLEVDNDEVRISQCDEFIWRLKVLEANLKISAGC
jgi:hypothetical protein